MAKVNITTTQNVSIQMESASVLHRAGAWLLDLLFFILGMVGLSLLVSFAADNSAIPSDLIYYFFLGYFILYLLYPMLAEALLNGQSLGKRAMGIKVVCTDGSRPTLGAYAIRWIIGLFELVVAFGSIAFLTILLSKNNQRIADFVAGTTVVKVKKNILLQDLALAVDEDNHVVQYPEARYLSDTDVQVLRDVLNAQQKGMKASVANNLANMTAHGLAQRLGITVSGDIPADNVSFIQEVITSYGNIHGR